jgi:four helix bundle protein
MINNYKELRVWQKSMELVKKIYLITSSFPKDELFGIVSQMRRSAISIPSNVAEGWMRQHSKEYIQFIYHALGSCGELETQLMLSVDLNHVSMGKSTEVFDDINHISRMLWRLIKALREIK